MNRTEFQHLADERIEDAKALLAASRWSGAYYVVGYSLECALKSCVIANLGRRPEKIFEEKDFSKACWTHNLDTLLTKADLMGERASAKDANPQLGINWAVAKDWNEEARYESWSRQKAENLFHAITDNSDGVLQWVKNYW